ncbi:MAG: TetR/AcrR family transcriptional regulator [Acidimicrobiales bacterium]|jgi:AcrR family transcriptional regulator
MDSVIDRSTINIPAPPDNATGSEVLVDGGPDRATDSDVGADIDVDMGMDTDMDMAVAAAPSTTRDRILDISLELFSTQGYDKTSLRQIAERLGFSKAAIYYHFASKEDILMALHLRLHEFGREALSAVEEDDASPELWAELLDRMIDQMLAHRALFILHERNQAAIEELHREQSDSDHEDLQVRFRRALSNEAVPVETRVRMSCAFGAAMSGLVLAGDVFASVPSEELGGMLRSAVHRLLGEPPR